MYPFTSILPVSPVPTCKFLLHNLSAQRGAKLPMNRLQKQLHNRIINCLKLRSQHSWKTQHEWQSTIPAVCNIFDETIYSCFGIFMNVEQGQARPGLAHRPHDSAQLYHSQATFKKIFTLLFNNQCHWNYSVDILFQDHYLVF